LKKLAIIHFQPVELYPPVMNLISALGETKSDFRAKVFTTMSSGTGLRPFEVRSNRIKLIRYGRAGITLAVHARYWSYFIFFGRCLVSLIFTRPGRILYFETISCWPAYVYKRFVNKKCDVFVHYHEYTSPGEYVQGMKLTRIFHSLEQWLYPSARWVSHTNNFRMDLFQRDILPVVIANPRILPNYPPKKWSSPPRDEIIPPVKIVYAGALSLSTMYTEAFAHWVANRGGKVTWDIYSHNVTHDAATFLREMKSPWISIMPGVDYNELDSVIKKYQIGVILYTGHIPNYVYNAPNKLFEYLACGLDVWFPREMKGSLPYARQDGYPKIVDLDFMSLDDFDWMKTIARNGNAVASDFFCERALEPLLSLLAFA
jgi:hypothetical protein